MYLCKKYGWFAAHKIQKGASPAAALVREAAKENVNADVGFLLLSYPFMKLLQLGKTKNVRIDEEGKGKKAKSHRRLVGRVFASMVPGLPSLQICGRSLLPILVMTLCFIGRIDCCTPDTFT